MSMAMEAYSRFSDVMNMSNKKTMVAQILTVIVSIRSVFTGSSVSVICSVDTIVSTMIAVASDWAVFSIISVASIFSKRHLVRLTAP